MRTAVEYAAKGAAESPGVPRCTPSGPFLSRWGHDFSDATLYVALTQHGARGGGVTGASARRKAPQCPTGRFGSLPAPPDAPQRGRHSTHVVCHPAAPRTTLMTPAG